jgi:proteasome lid subunit RPN8/RPN11
MPGQIYLPSPIYQAIIAHAQEGAPAEVCGVLAGIDGRATELVRGRNEAVNPIMDYWIDGQTLLKQFDFEDRGEAMIAVYHSHPVDEAYPSATDARNAFYPDAVYLICSLQDPGQPVIRGYLLLPQELSARPPTLTPVRGNPRFLARHHRDGQNDYYDLAIVEDDGTELFQRVRILEQDVVVTGQASLSTA